MYLIISLITIVNILFNNYTFSNNIQSLRDIYEIDNKVINKEINLYQNKKILYYNYYNNIIKKYILYKIHSFLIKQIDFSLYEKENNSILIKNIENLYFSIFLYLDNFVYISILVNIKKFYIQNFDLNSYVIFHNIKFPLYFFIGKIHIPLYKVYNIDKNMYYNFSYKEYLLKKKGIFLIGTKKKNIFFNIYLILKKFKTLKNILKNLGFNIYIKWNIGSIFNKISFNYIINANNLIQKDILLVNNMVKSIISFSVFCKNNNYNLYMEYIYSVPYIFDSYNDYNKKIKIFYIYCSYNMNKILKNTYFILSYKRHLKYIISSSEKYKNVTSFIITKQISQKSYSFFKISYLNNINIFNIYNYYNKNHQIISNINIYPDFNIEIGYGLNII